MASRSFPWTVYPQTDSEDSVLRLPDSPVAVEDALLVLADIIEEMLNEASGLWRSAPDTDDAA